MLQTLINASIIWLCSLLVYEAFLKKLTFHRWNRFFLLLSFAAGFVLPALPYNAALKVYPMPGAAVARPVSAAPVQQSTTPVTSPPARAPATEINYLLLAYLCGVCISVCQLLREIFLIRKRYRSAAVWRIGHWQIAETGIGHQPFSLLNIIFVASREQYTDMQWQMVLSHEQQHYKSRHFLDLALLQTGTILCWFHPLVYIYRRKLRMIHEFEVDSTQTGDLRGYGGFLLEQAASHPLQLTHTLNFSPLKTRIRMMTTNSSSRKAKLRFLLVLPMMSCFIWACTENRSKTGILIDGDKVSRKDADVRYLDATLVDTNIATNMHGVADTSYAPVDPIPLTVNGKGILVRRSLGVTPQCRNPGESFSMKYILEKAGLEQTLVKLGDGSYRFSISNIVIDPSGRVASFTMLPILRYGKTVAGTWVERPAVDKELDAADYDLIKTKIAEQLIAGNVRFSVVKDAKGHPAPYFLEDNTETAFYDLIAGFKITGKQVAFTSVTPKNIIESRSRVTKSFRLYPETPYKGT
jgi:hypothetical protein